MPPSQGNMELQAGHQASILPWLGGTRLCAVGVGRGSIVKERRLFRGWPETGSNGPGRVISSSLSKQLPGLYKIFRVFYYPVKVTWRADNQE